MILVYNDVIIPSNMPNVKTHQKLRHEKDTFCHIRNFEDLARVLVCPPRRLYNVIYHSRYKEFEVPKGNDKFRYIETPYQRLKEVQQELNRYLQAVYYFERTPAAFGFMPRVVHDAPRNILTNAKQHLGKDYLLNIDLKSFFHQISHQAIFKLFQSKPFYFNKDIASKLTRLTTYKGRLPMGTSTSPVLSNLATRQLDKCLLNMAKQKGWTYTRYVDDLSFSSNVPFSDRSIKNIKKLLGKLHFEINPNKVALYNKDQPKEVTGLLLQEEGVGMPDNFITETYKEIKELKEAYQLTYRYGRYSNDWSDRLKRRVMGRINFVGFVLGRKKKAFLELKEAYKEAIVPPSDYVPMSWSNFNYCNVGTCN